jgi:MFS family permease
MMNPVRRLTLPPMIAFGIGQAAEGMKNTAFNTFVLFFYQQVIGVSGTLTGIALGGALCFDAVFDPVIGAISDKTRTRWGRRHPFMLAAVLPLGISFYFLFNPPAGFGDIGHFWLTVLQSLCGDRSRSTSHPAPCTRRRNGAGLQPTFDAVCVQYAVHVLGRVHRLLCLSLFLSDDRRFNPGC